MLFQKVLGKSRIVCFVEYLPCNCGCILSRSRLRIPLLWAYTTTSRSKRCSTISLIYTTLTHVPSTSFFEPLLNRVYHIYNVHPTYIRETSPQTHVACTGKHRSFTDRSLHNADKDDRTRRTSSFVSKYIAHCIKATSTAFKLVLLPHVANPSSKNQETLCYCLTTICTTTTLLNTVY